MPAIMTYTNKVASAVAVATAVLFLAITIVEAQPMPKVDPLCAFAKIPDIIQICYLTVNVVVPSDDCCNDLKSANDKQVTCLCDNFLAHPSTANLTVTQALYNQVHIACGVQDKFACKGGDTKGGDTNGGLTNKIAVSMGLFGLVASLFF